MKTKLTNMLRGKKRKNEQIFKVKKRQMKKIYMHQRLTAGEKNSRKDKQRNKCRKKYNRFKNKKIKL